MCLSTFHCQWHSMHAAATPNSRARPGVQCLQQLVSKLGQMEKAIEIFGQGMPKSQNFLGCRGCAPERRVVKQAAAKQAAAKLLKLGQMKEKANGCQQKASYLTGLIYKQL